LCRSTTCAVLMEPIQGEGGVVCAAPDYLKRVRQICDRHDLLLIFDEIQTGMGRTGQRFAYEHAGVAPDIMTLAKALANGLPMGAMLATEAAAQAFGPGVHASTFGGTPIVCAAALAVMKLLDDDPLLAHVRDTGDYFKQRLQWLTQHHTAAVQVRGQGLLLGLVLTVPGADIVTACRERGFLINCIQDNILRFAPPLIIKREDIDALIACLDQVLTQTLAEQSGA
jgi:acetylornithine/N-succinyldiaminopimelate aminotransferase